MFNLVRTQLMRLYQALEIQTHPLKYLFLEITQKCNLSCLHCGSDCKKSTHKEELTTEHWKVVIDDIHQNFGDQVVFVITGGEPLLHPDLLEITAHINSKNMRWGMVSNGFALTQPKFDQLRQNGLYSITISLDGLESIHNRLRGHKDSYKKAVKAIKIVTSSDIPMFDIVTCAQPAVLGQLDELAEHLIGLGVNRWRIFRIFPSGRAADNDNILLSFDQTWELLDWIKEKRPYYQQKGLSLGASCEGWVPMNIDQQIRDFPFFCRSGVNFASVLSDGTITGCSNNHSSFYQGNVLKDDFKTTWDNEFQDMRQRKWVKNTSCKGCKHLKICKGGSIHLWNLDSKECAFCYMVP